MASLASGALPPVSPCEWPVVSCSSSSHNLRRAWLMEFFIVIWHREMPAWRSVLYPITRIGLPVLIGAILCSFFYSQVSTLHTIAREGERLGSCSMADCQTKR